jgi:hypothetical protein
MIAPVQNRVACGPQVGAPPSLEQVPVGRLSVDPSYQRATDSPASRRIIIGMVKKWDWALCQPLVVSRRADGDLLILDGQHRHAGAIERGDIHFLPCVVLSSLGIEGEAKTFVELNTRRQRLTQAEVFHGMLAAGDPKAKAVADLITQTGWTVRKGSNTAVYKPGDLECAPMLVKVYAFKGEAPVRFALSALRAAYPETPVRQSATLLKALIDAFDMMLQDPVPTAALIAAIGAVQPDTWLSRGIIHRERFPAMSIVGAIAATMIAAAKGEDVPSAKPVSTKEAYIAAKQTAAAATQVASSKAPGMAAKPALVEPRPSAPRPTAKPSDFAFGTTGKGWCSQCEQLVSRAKASACTDRFCKARPHT